MNVLWLCAWQGAEVLFCGLYVVQCEHLWVPRGPGWPLASLSISVDFGFNAILPHAIIANRTQFPIKFMKSLDPATTDRLKIWRGATAWNTAAFMRAYLRLLHERWQSYSPEKPFTLLFDCPPFYCEVIGQNIGVASPSGTDWCYRCTSTARCIYFSRPTLWDPAAVDADKERSCWRCCFPRSMATCDGHCNGDSACASKVAAGFYRRIHWKPCNGMSVLRLQLGAPL